jgi:hypothetical protein
MTNRFYKLALALAATIVAGTVPAIVVLARPQSTVPIATNPDVKESAGRVDQVFAAAWKEAGVEPLGPAEPMLIVRRLSLALAGTIPSLEEIRALEKFPPDKQTEAHLEHLLADRRYADYFAERLSRAFVGTDDGPFLLFRRRRFVYWLSDELMGHRPYDDLVREIISAEGLWTDQPATNFITARIIENQGPDPLALAARTARAFLGVRIDCAQCHDHPFAEWKQRDFEGLAAFFAHAKQSFRGIEDKDGELKVEDIKTKEQREVSPRLPFAENAKPNVGRRREQLAQWIISPKTKQGPDEQAHDYFAEAIVNRVWTLLFGQGICEPVDDLEADRRVAGALEALGDDFRSHGHDLRRLIRVIVASQAFRMSAGAGSDVTEEQEKLFAAFPMTRLRSEQIAGALNQAASLQTVDADSHIIVRTTRFFNTIDFIKHYGDAGEEELNAHVGTIPQRLVMMNGKMPRERVQASPFNAAGRIARLAPSDESRVRTTYLVVLTRLPTRGEENHFLGQLKEIKRNDKHQGVEDLLWTLFNSTEFSWNH